MVIIIVEKNGSGLQKRAQRHLVRRRFRFRWQKTLSCSLKQPAQKEEETLCFAHLSCQNFFIAHHDSFRCFNIKTHTQYVNLVYDFNEFG